MRWKLYGDGRDNQYKCFWFMHVRTGTLLLGIYSLLTQIIGLFLTSYMLLHPDAVPQWMSSFEMSRIGTPPTTGSICDGVGVRHKRGVDGMMGPMMSVMNSSMMHGRGMHGPMMHGHMHGGMHGGMMLGGGREYKEPVAGVDDDKVLPRLDDFLLRGGKMQAAVENMKPKARDSVGIPLTDVLSKPNSKISAAHHATDTATPPATNDDTRSLIIPVGIGSQHHDISHDNVNYVPRHRLLGLNADDKFFMYMMIISCIAASLLLIVGVIKGRPGHMIPYMGLQAFDFCASALFTFALFSYMPYLKDWLLSLPDSFPHKCALLAMKIDCLVLAVILLAIGILVMKAYLMGMVWSCYKYLTEAGETGRHRRSLDADLARSPEDAELLLPPKYEDIASMSSVDTTTVDAEAPPPAYAAV